MKHFIYLSHICCSFWRNSHITKTWTKLLSQEQLYVRKHRIKHTNKVCVSPPLVTDASGTMSCYCYPTSPKIPSVTAAGLEWDGNTRTPTRAHCRSSAGLDKEYSWTYSKAKQDSRTWSWPGRPLEEVLFPEPLAWGRKTIWIQAVSTSSGS